MTKSFRNIDLGKITDLFNEFAPDRYRISEDTLRRSTVDSQLFDWGASQVKFNNAGEPEAFVAFKKSAGKVLYQGPDPDQTHLTIFAYRDPNVAVDLFRDAKHCLRDRGVSKIVFGQDSRHIFPGSPVDFPAIRDYLIIGGFEEGGDFYDLERNLADYKNPFPTPAGDVLRPVTANDKEALDEFFLREFPERWRYDVLAKLEAENDPGIVFGLFHGQTCDGFALLQWDGCKMPIGGAVWNPSLGAKWGSLGPIGVSASLRGKGSGNALLGAALEHLQKLGTQQCIIDWTTLAKFYGGHGFEIARTYRSMTLDL